MPGLRGSFCLRRSKESVCRRPQEAKAARAWSKAGLGYNPRMLGGRSSEQWIAQYASSHTHPVNRFCHSLGIPLIVVSLALAVAAIFFHPLWMFAAGLFVFGWLLQFIGHAFEHKEPEFFQDWRFLLVGVRWWWAKMRGRA